jgi:hypothetical protein
LSQCSPAPLVASGRQRVLSSIPQTSVISTETKKRGRSEKKEKPGMMDDACNPNTGKLRQEGVKSLR